MKRRTFLGLAGLSASSLALAASLPDYEPVRRYFFMYPRTPPPRRWWVMSFPEVTELHRFSMVGGGFWRLLDAATHEVLRTGSHSDTSGSSDTTSGWGPFPAGVVLQASREPLEADLSVHMTLRCDMQDLVRFLQDEREWSGDVTRFVASEYAQDGLWRAENPPPFTGASFVSPRRPRSVPAGHRVGDHADGVTPQWLLGPVRGSLPFGHNDRDATDEERTWLRQQGVPASYFEPRPRPRLPPGWADRR